MLFRSGRVTIHGQVFVGQAQHHAAGGLRESAGVGKARIDEARMMFPGVVGGVVDATVFALVIANVVLHADVL